MLRAQSFISAVNEALTATRCAALLFALDVCVTLLTVTYVPYTEIDWSTYMQQICLVRAGERNYTRIIGDTGPCVYPGGYIWLYSLLSVLSDGGAHRFVIQLLFALLYLCSLALALTLALRAHVPRHLLPLFVLSRRVHSVFALRLFNDAWVAFFLLASLFMFTSRAKPNHRFLYDVLACLLYSAAVSVKMGALLIAPALLYLLLRRHSILSTAFLLCVCASLQIAVAWPFLVVDARAYLTRSFDLGRVFEQRWSVNGQILSAEYFVSSQWAALTLFLTIIGWTLFFIRVWLPSPRSWQTNWFSSLLVGLLFARSLHYQFYSWYFFSLPLLLHRSRLPLLLQYLLYALIELVWTRYPPSIMTSAIFYFTHGILVGALAYNGACDDGLDVEVATYTNVPYRAVTRPVKRERLSSESPLRKSLRQRSPGSTAAMSVSQ